MRALAIILLSFISTYSFAQSDGYIKGEKGIEYKIISSDTGNLLKKRDYVAMHYTSSYQSNTDSLLYSTYQAGTPQILKVESMDEMPVIEQKDRKDKDVLRLPSQFLSIFIQLRKGDSVSSRLLADSAFKDFPENKPKFIQFGHYIYTNFKIVEIYNSYSGAHAAKDSLDKIVVEFAEKQAKQQAQIDELKLKQYFGVKKIRPEKTPKGAYILIKSPGIGLQLDKHCVIKINYTGKNLAEEVFDSNTDSAKGHTEPLTVNLTDDPDNGLMVIPGLADALLQMKNKGKATIYTPSGLAYGNQQRGDALGANENLIFEVEVLSVKRMPAKGKPAPQKKAIIKKPIKHK